MAEETTTTTTTETALETQENAAETTQAANTSESTEEKKFTQSDLDAAVKSRLDRERKNQPSKDELKAFREWQESQKTEAEKTADKIKQAEDAKTAAELKVTEYEAKFAAMAKGVRAEAVEDVIALAKNKVSGDLTLRQNAVGDRPGVPQGGGANRAITLEQAIDSVIAKYPQFSTAAEKPSTTGVSTPNNKDSSGDSLLRKAMGLSDDTKG